MAQAIWQKWISNAIAKTINMSGDVTAEDVKCAYLLSHDLGLKGVTVYRDGSRHEQVLHITGNNLKEKRFIVRPSKYVIDYVYANIKESFVREQIEKIFKETETEEGMYSDSNLYTTEQVGVPKKTSLTSSPIEPDEAEICPSCKARLIITEGCNMCIDCGFSSCLSG